MRRTMKLISSCLILCLTFSVSFWLGGCREQVTDFEFTDEVIAKIDDMDFSNFLINYCNEFYKHFKEECNKKLLIENEAISSSVAKKIISKIDDLAMSYYLAGDENGVREMVNFYLPFQKLGAIRAQESLETNYNFTDGKDTWISQSPLSQKYIDGINEQFLILKESYFKK